MKQIRLKRLELRDFQGGSFTLIASSGEDVDIHGANAAGKTRLASAFSWLLFDKDSLGRSDFSIKNLDVIGNEEHMLEHSVEGTLDISGMEITLKKIYKEIWTKKRGRAEREFSGHTTEYFIDGVPTQKKDYQQRVAEITSMEDTFRLLTSPTAFPALHWQKQRALLLEICGDISDADVIASDKKLSRLPEILGKRSLDDHRKVVTARRTEINKELTTIPNRIDENKRMMPDVTGLNREEIKTAISMHETAINEKKLSLSGIDTGGALADLTKRVAVINSDIQKMESSHYAETMKTVNKLNQEINEITSKLRLDKGKISDIDGMMDRKKATLKIIEDNLPGLRDKWAAVDAETLKNSISDTCPACMQSLPSERVNEAREKAKATFNVSKSERLTEIEQKGTQYAQDKERLTGEIDTIRQERDAIVKAITPAEIRLLEVTAERDAIKKAVDMPFEHYLTIPGYKELLEEKDRLNIDIHDEREGQQKDLNPIREEIIQLQHDLNDAKEKADRFVRREAGEKRIAELMESEKLLASEFEKLEEELFLCDLFIKTKVDLLSERINNKFSVVRFKLFSQNINGGIEPCCEITVGGVPFAGGLNNAARIQAGCDVIRTLQQHYGLAAPVIVDNRESVTEIPTMPCQIISLIVSPEDKTLRVEVSREAVSV